LNTKEKVTTQDVGNTVSIFGRAHHCGGVNQMNGILSLLIIISTKAIHI
jgi:hypothetical protein